MGKQDIAGLSRKIAFIFAIAAACTVLTPQPSSSDDEWGFINVLGAGEWGYDEAKVIEDIKINDLQIRRVRVRMSKCQSGYRDHLQLSGPKDADTSLAGAKLLEKINKDGSCHCG